MLHKFRRAMVNLGREPLRGEVEVDDTWVGGTQAGLRGSRQLKGRKAALVLAAVEKRGRATGRARMAVIPDVKGVTVMAFLKNNVAPGSTVYTDGLKSFTGLQQAGFQARIPHSTASGRVTQRREIGRAACGPRNREPAAMADRDLSRRESRATSGLS